MMIASPKAEILLDTQRGRTRHVMTLELQNILSGHLSCLLFLSLLYSFFFFFLEGGVDSITRRGGNAHLHSCLGVEFKEAWR